MLKIITLNCQRAYQPQFGIFLEKLLKSSEYDFILLQEANSKVHKIVSVSRENYDLIFTQNEFTKSEHEICLIYKKDFELIKKSFLNFHNPKRKMLTQSGCAAGLFRIKQINTKNSKKEFILIGSLHLQASYHARTRKKELMRIKEEFDNLGNGFEAIKVLGGDFNNLGPWEKYLNGIRLKPSLRYASYFKEHTHDSAFLEAAYLKKPLARFFLIDKLKYKVKLDHYYIDNETFDTFNIESETLKVEVSDHRPVVIKIK